MKLERLTVRYEGLTVMQDLTLELPDRGMACLFAPSGSGKTTLLRVIGGLLRPDSGRVIGLEGKKPAFVFQEDRLVPGLSAEQNVALVLDREHQPLAGEFLRKLELSGWEDALPAELSGGMKRRVAIARALAYGQQCKEVVYLLDEPLKGLDEQAAATALELIRRQTADAPGFFITHDYEEAQAAAEWVVCLEGRPMQVTRIVRPNRLE